MNDTKVTVLMSVYHPEPAFLQKQLESIDEQTYPEKQLLIWIDDPADTTTKAWIEKQSLSIPFEIRQAKENLGYVKAFEKLVSMANTPYIAFSDQDDIWDPKKLEKCIRTLEEEEAVLVTTDLKTIDQDDQVLSESDCRDHTNVQNSWRTGDHVVLEASVNCMAIGMAIVMRADAAKAAIPFPACTGHDKWLALTAGTCGKLAYIKEPLVSHRVHGRNLTGALSGITCKKDYKLDRIDTSYELAREFASRFSSCEDCGRIMAFATARKEGDIRGLWKNRQIAPDIVKFEILYQLIPDFLFKLVLQVVRKFAAKG